jgi:NodT family efflux transporter outer membrane factor (OMF) lipoprotein
VIPAGVPSTLLQRRPDIAAAERRAASASAQIALLTEVVEGYRRSLKITQNRFDAGVAPHSDVLQAQSQLSTAEGDLADLGNSRAAFEHAIAVLVGETPSSFSLAADPAWRGQVPVIPAGVPSTLLQRRPDIASAERAVAAANAQIGIARSAYFPSFGLNASISSSASRVADLFNASHTLWSLGLSVAQVVFDAGAIGARVDAARAAHEAAVARYRQTVLASFQSVEDQLSAATGLAQQEVLRREASLAADKTEQQFLNRYRSAQIGYTDVVTAQAAALSARRAVLQVQLNRQTAAVQLIQALGGGWQAGPDS